MRKLLATLVLLAVVATACATGGAPVGPAAASGSPSPGEVDATDPPPTAQPALPAADGVSLRFGRLTDRTVDIGADGQNVTAVVAGMNAFAIDLYSAVSANQRGNVVLSPYSVTFALSMVYAGARGNTAREMASVLRSDLAPEDWQEGINAYDLTLDARTVGSPTTWSAGNKVWAQPGLALRDEFLDVLTGVYGSPLAEANFATDVDSQREAINGWVAEQTKELIPTLFPQGSLGPDTAMVLVNAVALDAPWEFPFDPADTGNQPFTLVDGSIVDVDMMRYNEFLPSVWTEEYQAVELPYGGGALSMVIVVPQDLAAFEATLSAESLAAAIDSVQEGGIHLTMPKWSARTHVTLNDTLSALGMPSAFGADADFSGMVEGGGLRLGRVEHEAFIEVDEVGTRAAAATGGVMVGSHGATITVDRPFLYVIRDRGAGTILFIGRVTDPTIKP